MRVKGRRKREGGEERKREGGEERVEKSRDGASPKGRKMEARRKGKDATELKTDEMARKGRPRGLHSDRKIVDLKALERKQWHM